jgi:hypothetical protein
MNASLGRRLQNTSLQHQISTGHPAGRWRGLVLICRAQTPKSIDHETLEAVVLVQKLPFQTDQAELEQQLLRAITPLHTRGHYMPAGKGAKNTGGHKGWALLSFATAEAAQAAAARIQQQLSVPVSPCPRKLVPSTWPLELQLSTRQLQEEEQRERQRAEHRAHLQRARWVLTMQRRCLGGCAHS